MQLVQRIMFARNFYEVMGVTQDATYRQISLNWRAGSLLLHDDRIGNYRHESSGEAYVRLSVANDCLMDPVKSARYARRMAKHGFEDRDYYGLQKDSGSDDSNPEDANDPNYIPPKPRRRRRGAWAFNNETGDFKFAAFYTKFSAGIPKNRAQK